jgi:uncharacterized protein YhdP
MAIFVVFSNDNIKPVFQNVTLDVQFSNQSLFIEFENKRLARIKSPTLTTGMPLASYRITTNGDFRITANGDRRIVN